MPVATDSHATYAPVRAPRGNQLSCKGWAQEAAMRMLMNNLDPDVAERPQDLVVYGGTGRAARNWECYHAIVRSLAANSKTTRRCSSSPVSPSPSSAPTTTPRASSSATPTSSATGPTGSSSTNSKSSASSCTAR